MTVRDHGGVAPSGAGEREALCAAMRTMVASGLTRGTAGNMSMRTHSGFLITPSGIKPHYLEPAGLVHMRADGVVQDVGLRPSSEWRFHKDIYGARSKAKAIVHVHSPYATALACQRRDIPPFHYMIAVAGGDSIRCAEYATFGTQALSDRALAALTGRRACLLANHGQIAFGASLEAALDLAGEVEELARQYLLACGHGVPILLNADEMRAVTEQFKGYGAGYGQSEEKA